jgi:DMSO/TMAO reductase YedYZ molybdopterin-dependent catalytic subunit
VKNSFASWKLGVEGLVEKPAQFSLADLRAMPPRTQITRHDCVEGWSCIGKWTGVPLSGVLNRVGVKPQAKYVVFYAADDMDADEAEEEDDEETENSAQSRIARGDNVGQKPEREDIGSTYYETIELRDAYHPQTILAYDMNGKTLTVPHGAPLRLRLERMLSYKMAKYLMRIELVESFADIARAKAVTGKTAATTGTPASDLRAGRNPHDLACPSEASSNGRCRHRFSPLALRRSVIP